MTESEVVDFLRSREAIVMFDTNVIFGGNRSDDPFIRLCTDVKQWRNEPASGVPGFCFSLSSVVLSEKVKHLRQSFGVRFDPAPVQEFIEQHGIKVFEFDQLAAEATGSLIGMTHPTQADWHAFKRRRCLKCLKLPENHEARGTGQDCGATIDWLVAGHALHLGALLVTHDQGPEFAPVRRKTTLPFLQAAVTVLRTETSVDR